jgi:serine/threonine-protein kinase
MLIAIATIIAIGILGYLKLFDSAERAPIKQPEQSTKTDTTTIEIPFSVIPDSQKTRLPVNRSKAESFVLIERPPSEGGDFYIGKYEVTNREYMEFVRKTGHRSPFYAQDPRFNQPDQPVVGVSWEDAVAYCRWLSQTTGKSYALPTEEEWKFAAFGTELREYPWGDAPPSGLYANYDNLAGGPAPVRNYPQGATPDSIFDMGGNVWEWCNAQFDFAKTERVIRGGSWNAAADNMRLGFRAGEKPEERSRSDVGFRVVASSR